MQEVAPTLKILVTGGAGFIGSNFLNLFVPGNPHHQFINLDKLTYAANLHNLALVSALPNYTFIQADLSNYEEVQALFSEHKPNLVFHFAAESHVDRSIHGPAAFIEANIIGTFNLLEACRQNWPSNNNSPSQSITSPPGGEGKGGGEGTVPSPSAGESKGAHNSPSPLRGEGRGGGAAFNPSSGPLPSNLQPPATERRGEGTIPSPLAGEGKGEGGSLPHGANLFIHVSTDEVYGSLGSTGYFTETTAYDPSSPYSASKASSDHLVRAYHRTYGLPAVITNCSNNYGPYQFPEKLIPLMIINALAGKPLPVYGKGENVRDWLYVEDHCRALWAAAFKGKPGETYNIGGNNEWQNIAIVNAICDALASETGRPSSAYSNLVTFVPDRPGHDLRYAIDSSKIKHDLNWQPKENFESGLQKTVRWYLDNPKWVKQVQSGAYRTWLEQNYNNR